MTRFADLLASELPAGNGIDHRYIASRFRDAAARSRFKLWSPEMPIPQAATRILVGAADYSHPDLRLLDFVDQALAQRNGADTCWQVFDTTECQRMEDFEKYIPGIGNVYQTPVIGVWQNGVLTQRAWGKPAREIILQRAGLGPDVEAKLFAPTNTDSVD